MRGLQAVHKSGNKRRWRRRRILYISAEVLASTLRRGKEWRVEVGLPTDATVDAVTIDDQGRICMIVESSEYEPILDGNIIPAIDVVIEEQ